MVNFYNDVAELCRSRLLAAGYTLNNSGSPTDDVLGYLGATRKLLPDCRRTVREAPELVCPPDMQQGYKQLLSKAKSGASLRPHQSKRVAQAGYEDALLNAWDIHHFHLGTTLDQNGWVARTGPLLFARVTDKDFFCLSILEHGAWSQQELIRIIHRNWPSSIETFLMREALGLDREVTDEQVGDLRKLNVNVATEVEPGIVYMTPGMGTMSNGTSTWSMMGHMQLREICSDLQRQFAHMLLDPNSWVRRELSDVGGLLGVAEFHLTLSGDDVVVHDRASKIAFNFGPLLSVPPLK